MKTNMHTSAAQVDTDVVIIGAGPTGLLAAILLQHVGLRVRIFDKNIKPTEESRAFAVQARTLEILLSLDLAKHFFQHGIIVPGAQMFVDGNCKAEINVDNIAKNTPYAFILMVPQSDIEAIFIQALEKVNIKVEREHEFVSVEQINGTCFVTLQKKDHTLASISSHYVIGADGKGSAVRKALDLTFAGGKYPQNFMLADCKVDWKLDYSHAKIFLKGTGLAIYLPLKDSDLSRIITIMPRYDSEPPPKLSLDEMQRSFREIVANNVTLSAPIWMSRYRIYHQGVNQYSKDNVFLAGDAAHVHSPIGGQGMNTGLQDITNLVFKIALTMQNGLTNRLLKTYHSERFPVGQHLLRTTDRLFTLMSTENTFLAMLRNLIMPTILNMISHSKKLRLRMFRFISELGIHYTKNYFMHDDRLTHKTLFSKQLTVGMRAPNGLIARHHDVFDLLKGYQFHLLVLVRTALTRSEITQMLADLSTLPNDIGLPLQHHFICYALTGEHKKIINAESSEVFENYFVTRKNPVGVFLIRPDGYIAFISDYFDSLRLQQFLQRFNSN